MTDILNTKRIIQRATTGIPKGMKNVVFSSSAFSVYFSFRNENIVSEEHKTKNHSK